MDEMTRMDGNGSGAVDLNRASVEEIRTRLPGVGRQQAKRIVAHRQKHGAFRGFDDLLRVQGLERRIAERLAACRATGSGDGPLAVDVASFSGDTPPPSSVTDGSEESGEKRRGPRGTLLMDPGILDDVETSEPPPAEEDAVIPPSALPLVQGDSDPEADAVMASTVFASGSTASEQDSDDEDRTRVASLNPDSALDALDALETSSEESPSAAPEEEVSPGIVDAAVASEPSEEVSLEKAESTTNSEARELESDSVTSPEELRAASEETQEDSREAVSREEAEDEIREAVAEEEQAAAEEFEEATNDADAVEDDEDADEQPVVEARPVAAPPREAAKPAAAAQAPSAPVRLGPIALAALGIALGAGAMGALVARSGPPLAEREEVEAATRSVQEVKQETTAAAARITSVEAALDKSTERVRALASKTEEQDAALQTTHSSFAKMQKELATTRTDAARAQRDLATRIANIESALGLSRGSQGKRNPR